MRKAVNGRVVEISNIEIFEAAAEGAALGRVITNAIPNNKLDIDFKKVDEYIEIYKNFIKELPYPLYCVDIDIKYCAAGLFIKKESREPNLRMWVSDGLYIVVDEDKHLSLGFVNNSWGIVSTPVIKPDNLNIQNYYEDIGFEDFVWILATLFKGENTASYYSTFMPNFVMACGNQAMVLKWELSNILKFANTPDRIQINYDKIVDINHNLEYSLDIYVAGTRKVESESVHVWSISEELEDELRPKQIRVYGYDVYAKPILASDTIKEIKPGIDKIRKAEIYGINSLFCTLCNIKNSEEQDEFDTYTGLIADGHLVFSISNRIFVAKSNKYVEAKEIARGVEIYSYKQNMLYLLKSKNLGSGIRKETIYSYSLSDGNLRICSIQFVRI